MANPDHELPRGKDLSVSPAAATVYTLAISLPLVGGLIALYAALSPEPAPGPRVVTSIQALLFLAALLLGMFLHEMVHAAAWAYFGHLPLRRIKFGFHTRTLTPYAHALDPMPARAYRLGAALPALVLGALPYVIGTGLANLPIAFFGSVFVLAAGGDLLVLWLIRGIDARVLLQDHPRQVGCIVVDMEGK